MPFLRLTRDRRGTEHTFLLHADRPGDRPRLLYWYRTAPGILLGRAPLDEDAIRTIEEQHPDIDFDWPAILALSEVMTPEDEAPVPRREHRGKPPRQRDQSRERQPSGPRREPAVAAEDADQDARAADLSADLSAVAAAEVEARRAKVDDTDDTDLNAGARSPEPGARLVHEDAEPDAPQEDAPRHSMYGLLEELVGREIATRLRARYSEIGARIHEQYADASVRDAWMKRAEPLNPDLWLTAGAILDGVRNADGLFERLRTELLGHSSRE